MVMIVAVLAQNEIPRSTINYYNYRSQDTFHLTSIWMNVTKCQMTLKFKLKKVPHFFSSTLNKRVGVQAARKWSEGDGKF